MLFAVFFGVVVSIMIFKGDVVKVRDGTVFRLGEDPTVFILEAGAKLIAPDGSYVKSKHDANFRVSRITSRFTLTNALQVKNCWIPKGTLVKTPKGDLFTRSILKCHVYPEQFITTYFRGMFTDNDVWAYCNAKPKNFKRFWALSSKIERTEEISELMMYGNGQPTEFTLLDESLECEPVAAEV